RDRDREPRTRRGQVREARGRGARRQDHSRRSRHRAAQRRGGSPRPRQARSRRRDRCHARRGGGRVKQRTLLKLAWQSILKYKMRTMLTMLGIVIGVGAVIVMVAVGNGAQSQIAASITSLGTNLIVVSPGSSAQGGVSQGAGTFNRLTVADAEKLKSEGTSLAAVSPVISTRLVVIGPAGNWRTSINGVSPDYFTIRHWTATSG